MEDACRMKNGGRYRAAGSIVLGCILLGSLHLGGAVARVEQSGSPDRDALNVPGKNADLRPDVRYVFKVSRSTAYVAKGGAWLYFIEPVPGTNTRPPVQACVGADVDTRYWAFEPGRYRLGLLNQSPMKGLTFRRDQAIGKPSRLWSSHLAVSGRFRALKVTWKKPAVNIRHLEGCAGGDRSRQDVLLNWYGSNRLLGSKRLPASAERFTIKGLRGGMAYDVHLTSIVSGGGSKTITESGTTRRR